MADEPGGDVPDSVAERVRGGVTESWLVVEAEEPGPGGEVGGDIRGEDPALVDLPRFRREVAEPHCLGGADAVGLDGGVVPLGGVDELRVLAARDDFTCRAMNRSPSGQVPARLIRCVISATSFTRLPQ